MGRLNETRRRRRSSGTVSLLIFFNAVSKGGVRGDLLHRGRGFGGGGLSSGALQLNAFFGFEHEVVEHALVSLGLEVVQELGVLVAGPLYQDRSAGEFALEVLDDPTEGKRVLPVEFAEEAQTGLKLLLTTLMRPEVHGFSSIEHIATPCVQ